jgi:hypothetical protein
MTRTFTCACGWSHDYQSTLVTDNAARVTIQQHNLTCPDGLKG